MLAVMPGWQQGLLVAAALTALGVFALVRLVRRQVPWWPSVAAALLLFGPAIGMIVGPWAAGEGPLLFGREAQGATNLGWAVVVFVGSTALFGLVRSFLQSRLMTDEVGVKIPTLLIDAARWIFWLVMLFVVVGGILNRTEWFTALFTASAVGTVIIGFALQETLSNLFAGISLLSERTYRIGDWVWLGEEEGEVLGVSRRTTRLLTRTGDVLVMPNRLVAAGRIRNMSKPTPVHADFVYVTAPVDVPPNRVRLVLRQALKQVPAILADPPPRLRVKRFADRGVEYEVKLWTTDIAGVPDVRSDAQIQIWYHLRRAGIEIPYPVHEWRQGPSQVHETSDRGDAVAGIARTRLASVPFFSALPDEVLATLARGARLLEFGAGESVVEQGEAGDSCYVVETGSVAVVVADGGASRQVATLDAGDLFGEMSLLTGEPRTATVRALEDSTLLRLGPEALKEALAKAPELANRLAEAATLRREGLVQAKASLGHDARARVEAEKRRLGALIRRFFQLHDDPTHRP